MVLLSNVPELATTALYRMYYGMQFNTNGTEIDMGHRYLTTNLIEARALENSGPADKRPQRAGAYFREQGVNSGTGILGYIYTTQQPGTQQMRQIYRTDIVQKPTRPRGTSEGGTPTSFTPQENGDHVYTTNTGFEMTKPGTWRVEDSRGFVRPLGGNGVIAQAFSAAPDVPAGKSSEASVVAPNSRLAATHRPAFASAVRWSVDTTNNPPKSVEAPRAISVGLMSARGRSSYTASPIVHDPIAVVDDPVASELAAFSEKSPSKLGDLDLLFARLGSDILDLVAF